MRLGSKTVSIAKDELEKAPVEPGPAGGARKRGSGDRSLWIARYAMIGIMFLLALFFSLLQSDLFFTFDNLKVILSSQSILAVIAIAMLIPMTTGVYDLSAAQNAGLCAV